MTMKRISGLLRKTPEFERAIALRDEEMVIRGWQQHSLVDYDVTQRYLAIEDKGEIVSFLLFEQYELAKNIRIIGAWTHPDYRRRWLYRSLFDELAIIYRKKQYRTIRSGYHKDNKPSRLMQEKRGSVEYRRSEDFIGTVLCLNEEVYA